MGFDEKTLYQHQPEVLIAVRLTELMKLNYIKQ